MGEIIRIACGVLVARLVEEAVWAIFQLIVYEDECTEEEDEENAECK